MYQAARQLDWLAARYVLGELDAAEIVSFEKRLAVDLAAADAVVAAMRLVEAVAASTPTPAVDGVLLSSRPPVNRTVNRSRGAWRWRTVSVAASLAIAALPLIAMRRPATISEPVEIVWRWQSMPLEHVVGSERLASHESFATDRLPPWLVAAVSIAAEGAAQ